MQNLGVILRTFWEKAVSYLTLQMSLTDIIEIIIISVLIYYMLVWIKDTRAWMLLRGILVILAFVLLAVLFEMNTIVWIADKLFNVAMIAVVVIFQPEMRKALENLGRKNIFRCAVRFRFWPLVRRVPLCSVRRGCEGNSMLLSVRVRRTVPLAVRSGAKLSGSPLKP